MFHLLLIWQLLQHSKSESFPTGHKHSIPALLIFTYTCSFCENKEGVKRKKEEKKNLQKAVWEEIATLIAPILWLCKADCLSSCISGESPPPSYLLYLLPALSTATQVPLIVYVLNAEPLECIHF